MKRLSGILFALVIIAMGVVLQFLVGGSEKKCTVALTGTVIGYEQSVGDKGSTMNHAVISYSYENRTYEERSNIGTGNKPYADGEEVSIHINPDNPYEFNIDGEGKIFSYVSWGMIVLGALMLIAEIFKIIRFGLV